ncbi:MAG TPA: ABC transporter substrate binding protein [Bacillota bacterium]|nr:ABC transporter substrate binding protein [Bacillota bacterium]
MRILKSISYVAIPLILLIVSGALCYIFYPPPERPKNIGVLFYQNTPTAASFLKGFTNGLSKQGYYSGQNLKLFVENLEAPTQTIAEVLKKIEKRPVDLFITTGKDLTITVAHETSKIPIIYALVSRPIREETIKNVIDQEDFVTGVSYYTPYDRTLDLCKRVIPGFHKLTILLPQDSAWVDLDRLKVAATDLGIQLTLEDPALSNLAATIHKLRGQTDAIYLPNDIGLIRQTEVIKKALLEARLPAISNNMEFQTCSVLTYFAEPETVGEIASRMAVKIFNRVKMKEMPVELSSYFKLTINYGMLKELNLSINEDILSYANEVME